MKHAFRIALVVPLIFFFSCTRDNSGHWIVMKVKVYDYYTHEPIGSGATIKFDYKEFGKKATTDESTEGISYDDGAIIIKRRINRKESNHTLLLYGPDEYLHYAQLGSVYAKAISPSSDHDLVVYLKGAYHFNLNIQNISCTGSTDSLFIDGPSFPPKTLVGCIDTLLTTPQSGYFSFYTSPTMFLTIISKKNGIVDTLSQNFNLTLGETTLINIEY